MSDPRTSSSDERCPTCGAQLDRFTSRLHCPACNNDVIRPSNSSNMADALEALRLAEKQIDDYREALMEAEDGLGDGTEPDDVRTRIHLALRRKEYVGDRIRATISRCSSPETRPVVSPLDTETRCPNQCGSFLQLICPVCCRRVCDCPEGDNPDPTKHEGYCDFRLNAQKANSVGQKGE